MPPVDTLDNGVFRGIVDGCGSGSFGISNGENESFMYRNVLLTDKEIALLKRVVGDHLHEKLTPERQNLTIIFNRLRDVKPLIKYNQSVN